VPRTHKKKSEKSNRNLGKGVWTIHSGQSGFSQILGTTHAVKEIVYEYFQGGFFNITFFILVSYWGSPIIWKTFPFIAFAAKRNLENNELSTLHKLLRNRLVEEGGRG
jgi:hypothetical protein